MSSEDQAETGATQMQTRRSSSSTSASDASTPTPKLPEETGAVCSVEATHIKRLMDPESPSSPKEIAEFLHEMPHADPKMVGQVLGEPDAKSLSVLHEFANGFVFQDVPFDVALRVYLSRFELPSEAQKIDRILQAFAKAYYAANPDSLECPSEDAVYTLAFSVLLLNTDAHNPRLARKFKMNRADFIRNYHRLGGEAGSARPEVPDAYLGQCYDLFVSDAIKRIERKPAELLPDEVELEFPESSLGLEIETSFDGRTAVVKRYANDRHTYSSRRRRLPSAAPTPTSGGSSFLTSTSSFLATGSSILKNIVATINPEPEVSIEGWVIAAVGDDSTRQIGYALTRYLLKTAPRPVLIRFCEPRDRVLVLHFLNQLFGPLPQQETHCQAARNLSSLHLHVSIHRHLKHTTNSSFACSEFTSVWHFATTPSSYFQGVKQRGDQMTCVMIYGSVSTKRQARVTGRGFLIHIVTKSVASPTPAVPKKRKQQLASGIEDPKPTNSTYVGRRKPPKLKHIR